MPPELVEWLATTSSDPVAFVYGAFPWGEDYLADQEPDPWQLALLKDIRDGLRTPNQAIQIARASGHGIGKSAVVAWIILWAFCTAPDTRGVITANTEPQLKTKTWAELGVWFNRFIGREWFQLTATALLSKDKSRERTWRIDMIPWSEKNPEAFAGLHNKGRRLLLIFDEASSIDDIIWETAEGALTDADTEIIWCVFGNPTRNTGRFKDCFSSTGHGQYWKSAQIDSRAVAVSNKTQLARWVDTYGEDSDFVRVRVRGLFPAQGEMEFISASAVDDAMTREAICDRLDPLALGVDVARYGSNKTILFFRKGRDGRTIPYQPYSGLSTIETANRVRDAFNTLRPDGIFIDGGGVGGGVVDNVRNFRLHCWDIQFGARDDVRGYPTGNTGERYANKRAAMWGAMRAWISSGGALPNDPDLREELLAPHYYTNKAGEIVLESKEEMARRGAASPDRADALALTFAYPLEITDRAGGPHPHKPLVESEWNPYSDERMMA